MENHSNGYNISTMVTLFNSIPHLQLTNEGLRPLINTTFDYGRMSYINSLLVTLTIPLFVLLIIFFCYIAYLFVLRFLESSRNYYQSKAVSLASTKFQNQQPCHTVMVVCGFITIILMAYGIIIMNKGFRNTDKTILEFIEETKNSKQIIKDWNDYLQQQSSSLYDHSTNSSSTHHYYMRRLNETIASYTNQSSMITMKYMFKCYQWVTYGYVSINLFSSVSILSYWIFLLMIGCCCRYRYENRLKRFILITFTVFIFSAWMFDWHLVSTMAAADFCRSSKQSIADMAVYKFPKNNFSMPFVRYYLYCDIPKLDDHKSTVIGYLEKLDQLKLFKFQMGKFVAQNWNLVDLMRQNSYFSQTYQVIGCQHLNSIINRGLSQLCTKPIDGLTLITLGHLINFLLLLITLFMVTFAF